MKTFDGLEVPEGYDLRFVPLCFGAFNLSNPVFDLCIEHNYDSAGKRSRYYVLYLFGLHMTGGWLFEDGDRND